MFDFASFLTFIMYNFYNKTHWDTDIKTWTLVFWIPIFKHQNSKEENPILADKGLNMIGSQFNFCDFQVYIDLNEVVGVNMCVFRSQEESHQTSNDASLSDNYTRIGFSCQMSQKFLVLLLNTLTLVLI
jgi:hypothetical protein